MRCWWKSSRDEIITWTKNQHSPIGTRSKRIMQPKSCARLKVSDFLKVAGLVAILGSVQVKRRFGVYSSWIIKQNSPAVYPKAPLQAILKVKVWWPAAATELSFSRKVLADPWLLVPHCDHCGWDVRRWSSANLQKCQGWCDCPKIRQPWQNGYSEVQHSSLQEPRKTRASGARTGDQYNATVPVGGIELRRISNLDGEVCRQVTATQATKRGKNVGNSISKTCFIYRKYLKVDDKFNFCNTTWECTRRSCELDVD